MSLILALRKPLVRELILAVSSVILLYQSGKVGKGACAMGLLGYLLLTPNDLVFFRKQKPPQKMPPSMNIEVAQKSDNFEVGPSTGERYVIVGGSGFIGERLIHSLLKRGETNVVCFDIQVNQWTREKFGGRVEFVQGDVLNEELLKKTLKNAQVVFAPFAVIRFNEHLAKHFPRSSKTNVEGMKGLVKICQETGVKRLIVTSSSNCTFSNEISEYDDGTPYCNVKNHVSNYGLSKALGEEIALKANGINGLAVGSIRPTSNIFGFRDKNLFDRFWKDKAVKCFSNVPQEWVDGDDVIHAHLLLERALRDGPQSEAAGEAFYICGPIPADWKQMYQIISEEGKRYNYKFSYMEVPERLMWVLALFLESIYYLTPIDGMRVFGPEIGILSFCTLVTSTMQPLYSKERNAKAKRVLGYKSQYSLQESVRRTLKEYNQNEICS